MAPKPGCRRFFGASRAPLRQYSKLRIARIKLQGYAWASQAGAVLSNPFASKLKLDCKTLSIILLSKCPCFLRLAQDVENRKKHRVALGLQAGRCCEKASASPLASVFSATNPAFVQRIKPVFPVFLFDSFVPTHLALRANLRLLYRAPAPVLGCVYPSYPWLNAILTFAARITAVVRGNDSLPATRNPLLSFV